MADGNEVELQAVAETTGQFANNFLKVLADKSNDNLIASPLSAQVVLAMAAYGAGGPTATQMRSALLIPSDDELGQTGYQALIKSLNAPNGVELRLANKVYASIKMALKSTFKDLTTKKFLSASQEVDFEDAEGTCSSINNWCEQQTNNRIKNVITPDSLDPDTGLVLVNAVYFKGQWETKFDPSLTEDRPFHVDENTEHNVPTMFIKNKLQFGDLPELSARVIEIPYQGGEFSMVIVLPESVTGLGKVLDNLHKVNLSERLHQDFPRKVELYLPKFRIETTSDLKVSLEKLGMTEMFQNGADFSGISDTPLKVSKVIQKAFIEVNEEGSEAAAVTSVQFLMRCAPPPPAPPVIFRVDRPFYYVINHNISRIPLFTGVVHRPE